MNNENLNTEYIHNLFIQQIHNLSVKNQIRDLILFNLVKGEV